VYASGLVTSDLLTVSVTTARPRLKPSALRAWTCQRRIPYVKVGLLVRTRRRDAEAYITSRVVQAADPPLPGANHGLR
jgi:hypothetical protein